MKQRPQIGRNRAIGREFVKDISLNFDELDDRIAAKPAPVQDQSGIVDSRSCHRHGNLVPARDSLAPMAQAHEFVHAFDGFELCFEPTMPIAPGVFVEARFGEMSADAVVDLPGGELGMFAQRLSHGCDNAFGMSPVSFAVEANRATSAFMANESAFVDWKDFWMFLREPDGWRGGGCRENDFDAGPAEYVHHATQPTEVAFTFFAVADAPNEFADANDVNAGRSHHLGIAFPGGFWIIGS